MRAEHRANWFVGSSYRGTDDQMPRFLAEGIWENGYDDKLLDLARSMQAGERIAIKAAYTRKHGLPFDSRGRAVSVMGIKAVGTITENLNDGKRVKVDWAKVEPVREWYFYTHRATIWRVLPGEWMNDALIAFAFDGKPQDVDRFRNEPFGVSVTARLRQKSSASSGRTFTRQWPKSCWPTQTIELRSSRASTRSRPGCRG